MVFVNKLRFFQVLFLCNIMGFEKTYWSSSGEKMKRFKLMKTSKGLVHDFCR